MSTMDHDADLDAILEQVEAAGLVEQCVDEQGKPGMRLTPRASASAASSRCSARRGGTRSWRGCWTVSLPDRGA
jgi:hypothetical protein